MLTKLTIGAVLVLSLGLAGGTWALTSKQADDCCFPGSDCCYPGSPCCDDCCDPGSSCCPPGSSCCDETPKGTETSDAEAKKAGCCTDPTCPPECSPDCPPKSPVPAAKPGSGAKCEGGKCTTNCKAD